ncbi:PREDICTED: uncharacterized protein LOC108757070 isoform X2 [Trachymyrmex septentrionalis]|uniref:uncharacterized protein LOC108757070 isoform X2 n=1 Tax=Trachymyrmex septentrionalis TaxID=34720 RepID=UPI00084F16F8|nr:PREDICTED: uncharacterized protein LOC108757070 isoform X2 [Trachymyrmex septentrionalis]
MIYERLIDQLIHNWHNSLQRVAMSNSVLDHIKSVHDLSTQIDATAEIMITTLGKIPNEMYYLEDTTAGRKIGAYSTESRTILDHSHITLASTVKSDEYPGRSTLLIILLTTLLIILFMCCVTACIIAKSRGRHAFLAKSDVECSPDCGGVNQPLLDKASDATTRTSSTRN